MKHTARLWVIFVSLTLASSNCQKSGSSSSGSPDDGLATGTLLSALSGALSVPSAGGTSSVLALRTASHAGCQVVNATRRARATARRAKAHACLFGAMEAKNLIERPSTGYNYYSFSTPGSRSSTLKLRYGVNSEGNLQINSCVDGSPGPEIVKGSTGTEATITVTDEFQGYHENNASVHQLIVTATIENSSYTFKSARQNSTAGSHQAAATIEKGTPHVVTHFFSDGTNEYRVYAKFDADQGSSKLLITPVVGGSSNGFTDSWRNDSTYACIASATATYHSAVSSFDVSTIAAPTTPSYKDKWDCTVPASSTLTTVTAADAASALTAIHSCLSDNGDGAVVIVEEPCSGAACGI